MVKTRTIGRPGNEGTHSQTVHLTQAVTPHTSSHISHKQSHCHTCLLLPLVLWETNFSGANVSLSMLASCSAVGGARGGAWSCDCVALVDSISGREATFNTKQSQLTTHITCSVLKHEFQFGPHSLCRSLIIKKWHKVCITQWSQLYTSDIPCPYIQESPLTSPYSS